MKSSSQWIFCCGESAEWQTRDVYYVFRNLPTIEASHGDFGAQGRELFPEVNPPRERHRLFLQRLHQGRTFFELDEKVQGGT